MSDRVLVGNELEEDSEEYEESEHDGEDGMATDQQKMHWTACFEDNIFGDIIFVWTEKRSMKKEDDNVIICLHNAMPCLSFITVRSLTLVLCTSLTILTFYIQFVFSFYLVPAVADDEILEKVPENGTNQFEMYRDLHGARMPHICGGSKWSWPESVADDLRKYTQPAHLLLFFPMCQGRLFAIVCIGVWACVIAMQFRAVFHSFVLIFMKNSIQPAITQGEPQDPPEEIADLNWDSWIGKCAVIKVTFWRLLTVGYVGYYGMMFLAYTDNLKDFILNSVALAFIFEVPIYVHMAFMGRHTIRQIKQTNDAGPKFAVPKKLSGVVHVVLLIVTFVGLGYGLYYNKRFADMLTEKVYGQLCNETSAGMFDGEIVRTNGNWTTTTSTSPT